jgi:hypothetical protein
MPAWYALKSQLVVTAWRWLPSRWVRWCVCLALAWLPASPGIADGSGHVTFRQADGRVYRIAALKGATAESVSDALDQLAPGGGDAWLATSRDGSQLLVDTQRWDAACLDWACLAVVSADLSSGSPVHADGQVVHPEGFGAVTSGGRIVYPAGGGPSHTLDLWRLDRNGSSWAPPVLLTADSPYAFNGQPALSPDEANVVFDCGDQPYGASGTALCEVGMDDGKLRVVLAPSGDPPVFPGANTLHHPAYAPDGGLVFEAERDAEQIWRLAPGGVAPVAVAPGFENDNSPCVLPDGSIASLWLGRPGGSGQHELKILNPRDGSTFLASVGDIADVGLACGA